MKNLIFIPGLVIFLSSPLLAQVSPTAAETVHAEQLWERYRIEQQIRQATQPMPGVTITSPQPPITLDDKSQEKIFKLNQVIFTPLPTAIPLSEVEAIAAKYTAMEKVSIYDLYSMILEIDGLYDARHLLGRAGLPVQDVEDGTVTVEILEGRVAKTTLQTKSQRLVCPDDPPKSVHRLFSRHFIDNQFRFSGRTRFDLNRLEEEMLRFNRTFKSQIVAEIEPGDNLGESVLKLTRIVQKPVSGGYYVDNSGRETSGKIRNGVFMNIDNVFGLDESYFVSYDETEGTTALYMLGEMPISRHGTFFNMSYYYGTPTTIAGPWAYLGINGTSRQYRPGFRQILKNTKTTRLDAVFHYENYDSHTYFDTLLNYREQNDHVTLGLEYTRRGKKSSVFAGISVVTGHSGTANLAAVGETETTMHFSPHDFCLMKMNLMKIWYPNKKWTFIARGVGHAALSWVPQSQTYQIGGQATVRGTPEALMNGDSGYLVSLEGRYLFWTSSRHCGQPEPCKPIAEKLCTDIRKNSRAELFTFLDHGGVFYRKHPGPMRQADFLSSVGLGVMVNVGRHLSFMGGYGQPIFTAESHQMIYRSKLNHGNGFFSARATF